MKIIDQFCNFFVNIPAMDNLHVRLNVDLGKWNKIFYHSSKGHLKISQIAMFGLQTLKNTENIASRSL